MSAKRHSLTFKEKVEIVNVYNNEKRNHMRKLWEHYFTNDDFLIEDDLLLKNLAKMWRNSLHFQNIVFKTNTRQTTLLGYFNMI
jgi:hypothetical protein